MPLHPTVRKQKLKLQSAKLHHQATIADHRDRLRAVQDQLKALKQPVPKEPSHGA